MANPPRFVVGHHVLFTDTVQKVRKDGGLVTWESAGLPFRTRYWMNEGRAWQSEDTPFTKGVVVGQRFLSDYSVESDTDWDLFGREFTYTTAHQVKGSTRRAWLVSFDLHRKPALVLDEHIRPVPIQWEVVEDPAMVFTGIKLIEHRFADTGFHSVAAALRVLKGSSPEVRKLVATEEE